QTHQNLWLAIIVFGVWGYGTAFNFLFNNLPIPSNLHLIPGLLYLIFATAKFAGIVNSKYIAISRLGMLGCMVLSVFIGVMYFAFHITDHLNTLQGAFNFIALGIVQ